jgi:branched-chain amino acid transport system ATP-binding protein
MSLEVVNLRKSFGGITAVKDVTLQIPVGNIVGLIGPNGAGKSTLINLITGFLKPETGKVLLDGINITGLKPYEIVRLGICRTFQITQVFPELTVYENLLIPLTWMKTDARIRDKAINQQLDFFELAYIKQELAGRLSGGQKKLLELAAITLLNPNIYLLDEPLYGVHPLLKNKILTKIKSLRDNEKKTFLVVSHDIPSLMNICDYVYVMSNGEILAAGTPEEIRNDTRVIEAYLGGS